MARYTETIVAGARHAYENTDQPLHSIGADFHVAGRTVQRMATEFGWKKRSERLRDLPEAMQLLERAQALAVSLPAPSDAAQGEQRSTGADPASSALSTADEIEAQLRQLLAGERAAQAAIRGGARVSNAESERSARTLATLTRTLHVLERIRAGKPLESESPDDDDMPLDLDEFRLDLARQIEAFVASRANDGDAGGTETAAEVDKV